ncbi:MAG: hypothetical protein L3J39_13410 [Verrucomicrobiales bacterium]|nr:hypothetical protein [Verrucomicrobiales bacterium]
MNTILKAAAAITAASSLVTGLIAVKKHPEIIGLHKTLGTMSIAPIIIHKDRTVSFLDRIPPANVAADIRQSVRHDTADELNRKLVKYQLYVVPESNLGKFKN